MGVIPPSEGAFHPKPSVLFNACGLGDSFAAFALILQEGLQVLGPIASGIGGKLFVQSHEVGLLENAGDLQRLKVGPQSADSFPGPACYGRGGVKPTVTDANLVLGNLNPDRFHSGRMKLDRDASWAGVRDHVAEPLGAPHAPP